MIHAYRISAKKKITTSKFKLSPTEKQNVLTNNQRSVVRHGKIAKMRTFVHDASHEL